MALFFNRREAAGLLVGATVFGASRTASAKAAPTDARYAWRNVTVGGGGFIPGIVFSRVEAGLAYARSDMGGLYRIDRNAPAWVPLQDGIAESSYFGVESVAPDPVDPNVVYAAVGMYRWNPAAILRSADRGATWRITPVPFPMGGNEDGRGLGERLAVDPSDTRILYSARATTGSSAARTTARPGARSVPSP